MSQVKCALDELLVQSVLFENSAVNFSRLHSSFLPSSMQDLNTGVASGDSKLQQLTGSPESDVGYGTSFDSGDVRHRKMSSEMADCAGASIGELLVSIFWLSSS